MSHTIETRDHPGNAAAHPKSLRNLYYVRFGFAISWAGLVLAFAQSITPAAVVLLVLYPLFDVVAAAIDLRSAGADRPRIPLFLNMALSLLTAAGLAFVATAGIPAVLRIWGVWAITAGVVQVIVALRRYRLGGQWAMILSGAISVFAGASFILMAGGPNAALTTVAGYATLGGVFFLISAIRLHRLARRGR